jgi:two-component system osmolarity sensor histidine kinase EnvZ
MALRSLTPSPFWRTCAWLGLLAAAGAAAFAWAGGRAAAGGAAEILALAWATAAAAAAVLAVARQVHPEARQPPAHWPLAEDQEDPSAQASRLAGEIRDINAGFQRIAREIARAESERALMLAGISHDLRTPLARLRLEAEMSVQSAQARHHIAEDIEQLDRLIDQFIAYARRVEPTLAVVALRQAAEHAAAPFVEGGGLEVEVQVPAALSVGADTVELGRVLQNLLQNAQRYARPADGGPARVRIEARAEADRVVLEVRDHGPGVPEEQLDRLATPFFRGERARTAANGAGLGLAIVQRTVNLMGGSMRLRNAAGGGLGVELRLQPAPPAR